MTLTTSAAGHGLHPAFSKQPGINDRKSEFTEEIERTDYIQTIICRIRSVKRSSSFLEITIKIHLNLRWAQTFVTLFDLLYIGRLPVTAFKSLK